MLRNILSDILVLQMRVRDAGDGDTLILQMRVRHGGDTPGP